jgi:hypothetical protein
MVGLKFMEYICIEVRRKDKTDKYCFEGNTPTSTLKNDVAAEITATTPTNVVTAIDKITLVSGGIEKDSASLVSGDFTFDDATPKLRITKNGTVTSSYTLDTLRLYSGVKPYFTSPVSPPVGLNAGDVVTIVWDITMTLVLVSPTGILNGASLYAVTFARALHHILGQDRGSRNLRAETITAEQDIPALVLLSSPTTNDPTDRKVSLPATNFSQSGNLKLIFIRNTASPYSIQFILPSTIAVTTSDRLQLEFTFS